MKTFKLFFKIHNRNIDFKNEIDYFIAYLKSSYQVEIVNQEDYADCVIYYGFDSVDEPGLYINDNLLKRILYIKNDAVYFRDKKTLVKELRSSLSLINFDKSSNSSVVINDDLVAMSFCILSRIEETNINNIDDYGRHKIEEDSVYQSGHYGKAVVDYFLEIIILNMTTDRVIPIRSNYSIIATHDVDRLKSYHFFWKSMRIVIGDIVKRKDFKRFFLRVYEELFPFEPWGSIYRLNKIYKKKKIKVIFMIMGKSEHPSDSEYYLGKIKLLTRFIIYLKKNKYEIGVHPGVLTYNNTEYYKTQLDSVEKICKCRIISARQHVLKFDISKTPMIAEENGIRYDYTLSYPEEPGFRNGTTRGMNAYDFSKRKMLRIKLISTPIMDLTFHEDKYAQLQGSEFEYAKGIIDECYKYRGKVVFLYHSGFIIHRWHKIYSKFLEYALNKEGHG